VLGITAGVTDELRVSSHRAGIDAILEKPVESAQLLESVRYHLGRVGPLGKPAKS
jgi:DNA-binding response OmpR family regulator